MCVVVEYSDVACNVANTRSDKLYIMFRYVHLHFIELLKPALCMV